MRVWLIVERSWPDEAGRVPGGALGQLVLLDQHDVGPAEPGQVVGDAAARDPAADDHARAHRSAQGSCTTTGKV